MSCENCKQLLELDGVEPDCIEGNCIIPELHADEQRILHLRSLLASLNEIVDSGYILKLYDADIEDIEMLAFIEEELNGMRDDDKENDK